jgi:phosphoribosylanthranilate isomerase
MRVKFCGITRLEDAREAERLGAWAVGMIHHDSSPRRVDPEVAERIGAELRRKLEVVGVFVNPTLAEVVAAAENESLTMVQLHGDEGPSFCQEVARRTGTRVMKAFRVSSTADIQAAEAFRTHLHLFDAYRPGMPGGTGERFDWELLAARRSAIPYVLAGGLTPENVGEAVSVVRPYAVDVASGIEYEPGIKDHDLMARFFERAQPAEVEAARPAGGEAA